MKKYNLSKIMRRAWELVKKAAMTMSAALRKAWQEAKNPITTVTMCVVGKETFTVDAKTGVVTGKTYNSREFIKSNFNATWDQDASLWIVDADKFNQEIGSYPDYYKKYIVASQTAKTVISEHLVNGNDGFYMHTIYTDGSQDRVFIG